MANNALMVHETVNSKDTENFLTHLVYRYTPLKHLCEDAIIRQGRRSLLHYKVAKGDCHKTTGTEFVTLEVALIHARRGFSSARLLLDV
jgi:hypothetical protein